MTPGRPEVEFDVGLSNASVSQEDEPTIPVPLLVQDLDEGDAAFGLDRLLEEDHLEDLARPYDSRRIDQPVSVIDAAELKVVYLIL